MTIIVLVLLFILVLTIIVLALWVHRLRLEQTELRNHIHLLEALHFS